jgi:hypothetical protein
MGYGRLTRAPRPLRKDDPMDTPQHGGCYDCLTQNVPILYSMPIPGKIGSKAVCAGCFAQHHPGQPVPRAKE